MNISQKRLAVFPVVFLLLFSLVQAQEPPAPPKPPGIEERLKHVSEKIEKEITLTTVQKQKIKSAYMQFFKDMEELRAKGKGTPPPPPPPPPGKREDIDRLSKARDEQIKSVLNAAQYKKYQEIEKTLHPPQGPPPAGAPPRNK